MDKDFGILSEFVNACPPNFKIPLKTLKQQPNTQDKANNTQQEYKYKSVPTTTGNEQHQQ